MEPMKKLSEIRLWTKWTRPESIPYPNTWHKFTAKSSDGKMIKIKIVDLTPDRFEESLEFMKKYFYPYHPVFACVKLMEDEVSLHNNLCEQRAACQQRTSIIAVLDDDDVPKPEMIALLKLLVVSKTDEPKLELPGYVAQIRTKLMEDLKKDHDMFEVAGVDELIQVEALCVNPEYESLKVGSNMIRTIEKLAGTFGIKGVVGDSCNFRTQIVCERFEYRLLNEIIFNEYKDDRGQVIFPVKETRSFKRYYVDLPTTSNVNM